MHANALSRRQTRETCASSSQATKNQSNREITFDTQLKIALLKEGLVFKEKWY